MSEYESIKRYVEIKERDCETMPIRPSQALLNQRHLIDIIEKQREMIAEDEDYLGHKKYCQMGEIIDLGNDVTDTMDCTCGYNEFLRKRTCETIKLTEE